MGVSVFLYLLYFSAAVFLLTRCKFVSGILEDRRWIAGLFFLQAAAGILLDWIFLNYSHGISDYRAFHNESLNETWILLNNPEEFLRELTGPRYEDGYGNFFRSQYSFWNDAASNLIIKLLACMNLITGGHYYVNNLLLNIPAFLGHVALYRMFSFLYGERNFILLAGSFLLPTTLLFTSGTHKDLFIFTGLCFFFYALYMNLHSKATVRRGLIMAISFIWILLIRNYVAMLMFPAILLIMLGRRQKPGLIPSFAVVLVMTLLSVIITERIFPGSGVLDLITQKRIDFESNAPARSALPDLKPESTVNSFARNLPAALNHVLLRPYPRETYNIFHLAATLEMYFFLFLLAFLFFFFFRRRRIKLSAFESGLLLFSAMGLLLIGYIVPNYGSILRYRSIYFPFWITPLLMSLIPTKKIHIKL